MVRRIRWGRKHPQFKKRRKRRRVVRYNRRNKLQGFPKKLVRSLVYVDNGFVLNPAAGGLADVHAFRTNSMFDPDATGVGHQPMWRDQFADIYNNYAVIGFKASAVFYYDIVPADTQSATIIGMQIKNEASSPIVALEAQEQKHSVWTVVPQCLTEYPRTYRLGLKIAPAKYAGVKHPTTDDSWYAVKGNNPVRAQRLFVWAASANAVDNPQPISFSIRMSFLTIWFEPDVVGGS